MQHGQPLQMLTPEEVVSKLRLPRYDLAFECTRALVGADGPPAAEEVWLAAARALEAVGSIAQRSADGGRLSCRSVDMEYAAGSGTLTLRWLYQDEPEAVAVLQCVEQWRATHS